MSSQPTLWVPSRRQFLSQCAAGLATFSAAGAFAEELLRTEQMTEGPFYPDKLPLDTDNDLLILTDSTTPGIGEVTHLSGRVLTANGSPVRNALVEIWQVDGNGAYLHSRSGNAEKRDANFQGYGRFLTDSTGAYYFRTIKPIPYPGRTPHIHVAVNLRGKRVLTSQILIDGHPQNERDGLYRRISEEKRPSILSQFKPVSGSIVPQWNASFDLVLGHTPDDETHTG